MRINVLIIGLGLIGGSLGLALRESPQVDKIIGYDTDPESLIMAQDMGAIDLIADLDEGVRRAQVIILCTPLSTFPALLLSIKPCLNPGTIVTDVGSTKLQVMDTFSALLPDKVWGIGGHPMAGSEIKGIRGADRYLFENAVYVITPPEYIPAGILEKLCSLLTATGARVKIMEARLHDQLVATISHVPHIAAVSLVNITRGDEDSLLLAAGGFRDTTRIASSGTGIWEDILISNKEQIGIKLDELIAALGSFKQALANEDKNAIKDMLLTARNIRDKIPGISKGLLPGFSDIICIVPDRPGMIGQIGAVLGKYGINIVDIEILRAREGDGGTMRLGVPLEKDAQRAVEVLLSMGIKAWMN
ncbi:MAG: prephenate dehydrogenase/arogenate dehydrogenase family protein [Syntrophomonadaceae bacterium]|jgi:prephenate dehydrogenase